MTALRLPLLVLALLVTACSTAATASPTPAPTPTFAPSATPAPASTGSSDQPVSVSGDGTMQSSTFQLAGGNYAVKWTSEVHAGATAACSLNLQLRAKGGPFYDVIINSSVDAGPPQSRITHLHGEPQGSYYVDATTDCLWSATLTPE